MYGLYGVAIPVTGTARFFTGRSKIVVLVAGALCGGYASRKGKLDGIEEEGEGVDRDSGAGGRARPGAGLIGSLACCRGATGGGPGL
jgi:hypothetical protein